jgi:uncharacterized damage-inducible protein DinB
MHAHLQTVFDSVEQEKNLLIDHVSGLTPEEYFKTPAPGKWSVAQIMTHLMVAEQLSLRYMKKKSLGINDVNDSGVMQELTFQFYNVLQRLPIKLRAPKTILDHTPEPLSLEDLKTQWGDFRGELKIFLSTIHDKHIRRMIYKHAFAGRLDVIQALRFFITHIHHHRPQIDRIMRSSKR